MRIMNAFQQEPKTLNGQLVYPKILKREKNGNGKYFYKRATLEDIRKNVLAKRTDNKSKNVDSVTTVSNANTGGKGKNKKRKNNPEPTGLVHSSSIRSNGGQMFMDNETLRDKIRRYNAALTDLEQGQKKYRSESRVFQKSLDTFLALPYADDAPNELSRLSSDGFYAISAMLESMWVHLIDMYANGNNGDNMDSGSSHSGDSDDSPSGGGHHGNGNNYPGGGGGGGNGGNGRGGGGDDFGPSGFGKEFSYAFDDFDGMGGGGGLFDSADHPHGNHESGGKNTGEAETESDEDDTSDTNKSSSTESGVLVEHPDRSDVEDEVGSSTSPAPEDAVSRPEQNSRQGTAVEKKTTPPAATSAGREEDLTAALRNLYKSGSKRTDEERTVKEAATSSANAEPSASASEGVDMRKYLSQLYGGNTMKVAYPNPKDIPDDKSPEKSILDNEKTEVTPKEPSPPPAAPVEEPIQQVSSSLTKPERSAPADDFGPVKSQASSSVNESLQEIKRFIKKDHLGGIAKAQLRILIELCMGDIQHRW